MPKDPELRYPPSAPRYPSTQAANDANSRWYADEYRRLWHEVEAMRPVVEAALGLRKLPAPDSGIALDEAVIAYLDREATRAV